MSDTNDALTAQVEQFEAFGRAAGDELVAGELAGMPLVVVETPDLDAGVRNGVMDAIAAAGADVVVRIRLDPSLADDDAADRLASALSSGSDPDDLRQEFGRSIALGVRELADEIDASLVSQEAAIASATSTTVEPPTTEPAPTTEVLTTDPAASVDPSIATSVAETTSTPPATTTTTISPEIEPGATLRSDRLVALDRANLVRIEDLAEPFVPSVPLAVLIIADRRTGVATSDVLLAALGVLSGSVPVVVTEDVEVGDDDSTTASLTAGGARRRRPASGHQHGRRRRPVPGVGRNRPHLVGTGRGASRPLRPARRQPGLVPAIAVTAVARPATRDAGLIGGLTLVARVTGFARVLVVGAVLGRGALGDLYQTVNTVPNLLFELLAGGALQAALVPMFVAADRDDPEEGVGRAAAAVTRAMLRYLASSPSPVSCSPHSR